MEMNEMRIMTAMEKEILILMEKEMTIEQEVVEEEEE